MFDWEFLVNAKAASKPSERNDCSGDHAENELDCLLLHARKGTAAGHTHKP